MVHPFLAMQFDKSSDKTVMAELIRRYPSRCDQGERARGALGSVLRGLHHATAL